MCIRDSIAGLVASKLHPNPIPFCDVVTTTTHKTLRGPRGGLILCKDAEFGKKFDKSVFPGTQGGPLEHVIAAKALSLKPLVVKAAVPNLSPLVTKGDSGSNGTVFLFAVIFTSLTSKSAILPVIFILLKSSKTI